MASYLGACWEAVHLLRNSLLTVVERELKRVYGEEGWWEKGIAPRFQKERQRQLKEAFDARRKSILEPPSGDEKDLIELSDLHKVIEQEWGKVFKQTWPGSPLNRLKEVVDVRNLLAHPPSEGISLADARRLMDNCRFILRDVDAKAADQIKVIEGNLEVARKDAPLLPWYSVATPHEDIREGRLDEAVFAANVWAVVEGKAPDVYVDPEEFFRKTFMTKGLGAVLKRVAQAFRGGKDSGDRIISLQTAFGGGKTHTLVALWHLVQHAARLQKSPHAEQLRRTLGDQLPEKVDHVAVFTNHTCDPTQGRDTGKGVHTHTLWGEIAFQLGGKSLYEEVRPNDETLRVPQGIFDKVLRAAAPCLILIDELADYCVGAAGVPVGETTLADQTISFIQQLTEAAAQVPGVVVVATLPASKLEVAASEKGQEAFVTLEKRFQRLGADVKLVADDEISAVVRTRLFDSVVREDDPDYPERVAAAYQSMYAAHATEVPSEAAKAAFRDQIVRSFPFHPSLIEALYTRWGSHPDFQRTRGVLRLLASVVADLWERREVNTQSQALIQPCHIRWSIDALHSALTRLWGYQYEAVAAADLLGDNSNAASLDDERGGDYRREKIGQGLASAMLLGSFGGQAQRSGFSAKDLKLACSRPSLNWNYTDGALLELEDRCFYLHSAAAGSLGKRYWFGTKPNLNKLVVQYRQQVSREPYDDEILDAVRRESEKKSSSDATWRVLVNPDKDLAEQRNLTLLVLPPTVSWGDEQNNESAKRTVADLSGKCGAKDRTYRNTLLYLAANSKGLGKLRGAYRERAALKGVQTDYGAQLDHEQQEDLKKRLEAAEKSAVESLGAAYTVALRIAGQEVESTALGDAQPTFSEHLAFLWQTLVQDEEWILRKIGPVTLKNVGLVPDTGGIAIKDAVEAFLKFTDKPMIASRIAVTSGVANACRDGLLGIGRGLSLSNLRSTYCRQDVALDPNEDGVWIIPPFEHETEPKRPEDTEKTGDETARSGDSGHEREETEEQPESLATIRRIVIHGTVPPESWSDVFRCFVNPAVRMQLGSLKLGIQFELEAHPTSPMSPDDPALKAMRESARQLGLKIDEKG
jgi:hypothetical protein